MSSRWRAVSDCILDTGRVGAVRYRFRGVGETSAAGSADRPADCVPWSSDVDDGSLEGADASVVEKWERNMARWVNKRAAHRGSGARKRSLSGPATAHRPQSARAGELSVSETRREAQTAAKAQAADDRKRVTFDEQNLPKTRPPKPGLNPPARWRIIRGAVELEKEAVERANRLRIEAAATDGARTAVARFVEDERSLKQLIAADDVAGLRAFVSDKERAAATDRRGKIWEWLERYGLLHAIWGTRGEAVNGRRDMCRELHSCWWSSCDDNRVPLLFHSPPSLRVLVYFLQDLGLDPSGPADGRRTRVVTEGELRDREWVADRWRWGAVLPRLWEDRGEPVETEHACGYLCQRCETCEDPEIVKEGDRYRERVQALPTALMAAAFRGSVEAVDLLLRAGADPEAVVVGYRWKKWPSGPWEEYCGSCRGRSMDEQCSCPLSAQDIASLNSLWVKDDFPVAATAGEGLHFSWSQWFPRIYRWPSEFATRWKPCFEDVKFGGHEASVEPALAERRPLFAWVLPRFVATHFRLRQTGLSPCVRSGAKSDVLEGPAAPDEALDGSAIGRALARDNYDLTRTVDRHLYYPELKEMLERNFVEVLQSIPAVSDKAMQQEAEMAAEVMFCLAT